MDNILFAVGDCLDVFSTEPDESFDAFVSDPPAGVAFMSREWDKDHGGRDKWIAFWAARFRVMLAKAKPGAYSLTWALPRTSHWTATALEDAGWRIQDVIVHVFGTGWPKGRSQLKPAQEMWICAQKPISALDYAARIRAWLVSDSSAPTATCVSSQMGDTVSNIVSSWLLILEDACALLSTSTIATASSLTTDLKTLSCSPSVSMLGSTVLRASNPSGQMLHAQDVARLFGVLQAKCSAIRLLSATESVTSGPGFSDPSGSVSHPEGIDPRTGLGSEHWILARKPGTSVLQIDAARVARGADNLNGGAYCGSGERKSMFGLGNTGREFVPPAGSWPANVVLSHACQCEERGTRRVKGSDPTRADGSTRRSAGNIYAIGEAATGGGYTDVDGLETVPAFDCLAACACGASVLARAGGEPPRCACGAAMWWACPVAEMDRQSGRSVSADKPRHNTAAAHNSGPVLGKSGADWVTGGHADSGGASRFFHRFTYQAKASGGERDAGCEALHWRRNRRNPFGFDRVDRATWEATPENERARGNVHPTVKDAELMRHLVTLITPPGGRLGDITSGSGGTAIGALLAGNVGSFLGCDICPEAVEIAEARLAWWRAHTAHQAGLFGEHETIAPEPVKPPNPKAKKPKATSPMAGDIDPLFAR